MGVTRKHGVRNAEANRIGSSPGVPINEPRQDVKKNERSERKSRKASCFWFSNQEWAHGPDSGRPCAVGTDPEDQALGVAVRREPNFWRNFSTRPVSITRCCAPV